MGHEVVVFGSIEGPEAGALRARNAAALADLPDVDEWPCLVRGMFALPADRPQGTYRSHVVHFGASFKDEPRDATCRDGWIAKFEALLRRLHWHAATLHLSTEFGPDRVYRWVPTPSPADGEPRPVRQWRRSVLTLSPGADDGGGV